MDMFTPLLDLLDRKFWGNALSDWLVAGLVALAVAVALNILRDIIRKRLVAFADAHPTHATLAAAAAEVFGKTQRVFLTVVGTSVGAQTLTLGPTPAHVFGTLLSLAIIVQMTLWLNGMLTIGVTRYVERKMKEDPGSATTMKAMGFLVRLALWAFAGLLILDNAGVNVTALVAGLGIGGIAIAFAAQNILGDLFGSLTIVLDKPFVIGDFIEVDKDTKGTVEHIGLKTTRIRSVSGEQIVVPNGELLKGRIRNYKRLEERRINFLLGVEYGTPVDTLQKVPQILSEIATAHEKVRFERAYFKTYGDSALIFDVAFYVTSPDFALSCQIVEHINLEIYRRFNDEGVRFAFPTQRVFLKDERAA